MPIMSSPLHGNNSDLIYFGKLTWVADITDHSCDYSCCMCVCELMDITNLYIHIKHTHVWIGMA